MLIKIKRIKDAIIALKKKGEQEMTTVICPKCHGERRTEEIRVDCQPGAKMWGIIQCLECGHEFPITMDRGYIQKIDIALPGQQSGRLNPSVPADLKDDVKEAERANYSQCFKACVAMCRRALQLGLIEKKIPDGSLGGMIESAKNQKLIEQRIFDLATSIKGFGDIGIHRKEELEQQDVNMVIHATVRMLNELFK